MDLFSEFTKAYDNAVKKFFRSKEPTKVYIISLKCQRKEFFATFTEKEVEALKLKVRDGYVIGKMEREKSKWEEVQAVINHPKTKRHDEIVRYINAERRMEKLRERMKKRMDEAKLEGE